MYRTLKKGEESLLFSRFMINYFFESISKEIINYLSNNEITDPIILGAMVFQNVPLLTGSTINVWVEYNGKILDIGIDTGIGNCIIYDEIPDELLDRYNLIKSIISWQST